MSGTIGIGVFGLNYLLQNIIDNATDFREKFKDETSPMDVKPLNVDHPKGDLMD